MVGKDRLDESTIHCVIVIFDPTLSVLCNKVVQADIFLVWSLGIVCVDQITLKDVC